MMPNLLELLRQRWSELDVDAPPPCSGTVVGVDRTQVARVTMLLFAGGGTPVAVAKCARSAAGGPALVREHDALVRLQQSAPPSVRAQIPHALLLECVAGQLVLVQSVVAGTPMASRYYTPGHTSDRDAVGADFAAAGTWLAVFQRGTTGRASAESSAESAAEHVALLQRSYRASVGWSDDEAGLFAELAERAASLGPQELPSVAVHGDFWPGNLLVGDGGLSGVVDWELARASGHPYRDIFKFPMSYAFYLDRSCPWSGGRVAGHPGREDSGGRWRRYGSWPNLLGFGHAWFGEGWFPELVREYVERREHGLGVTPLARSVMFPAFLAEQALTLDVAESRQGYRSALRAFAAEKEASWVWNCAS